MTPAILAELNRIEAHQYGRALYWVGSRSRKKLRHLVDLEGHEWKVRGPTGEMTVSEPSVCTCEAFKYHGHRPCLHIIRAFMELLRPLDLTEKETDSSLDEFRRTNDLELGLRHALWLLHKPNRKPPHETNPPTTTQRRNQRRLPRSLPSKPSRTRTPRGS